MLNRIFGASAKKKLHDGTKAFQFNMLLFKISKHQV